MGRDTHSIRVRETERETKREAKITVKSESCKDIMYIPVLLTPVQVIDDGMLDWMDRVESKL